MMKEIIILLSNNMLFKALLICVSLDSILGALRAIKEHKFNSCVGIDGAIRKAAMLFSVCLLMSIDVIMNINVLSFVPEQYVQILGINKMGICEFFSLLFIRQRIIFHQQVMSFTFQIHKKRVVAIIPFTCQTFFHFSFHKL